jgi:predicted GH43/DUF377 family glycosyl hydrolase
VSDILVFESHNGADFTFVYRLFDAGHCGVDCYEDPRVQVVRSLGQNHVVMTYTNLPAAHTGKPWRIGAHRLTYSGNRFRMEPESGTLLGPDNLANKDAVVFNLDDGRVALIHRIHPDMQLAVFHDLEDLWSASDEFWAEYVAGLDAHVIISPTQGSLGVGAGAPPVETAHGLLLFFHERNSLGTYTMKVALLDSSTGVPIVVHSDPLMVPELDWERWGDVDDVIFVQGAHLLDDGDTIFLTYGAADRCVGGATTSARAVLDAIGHT